MLQGELHLARPMTSKPPKAPGTTAPAARATL